MPQLGIIRLFRGSKLYSLYVLFIFIWTYLFNQMVRFMLAICTSQMGGELKYGDVTCCRDLNLSASRLTNITDAVCKKMANTSDRCDGIDGCQWRHSGLGLQYQIVAGPVFIIIYTLSGIPLGFLSERRNRVYFLTICLIAWSAVTFLTGFVTEYWQMTILRFGLGIATAGCTPFVASMIGDYFEQNLRGLAMGLLGLLLAEQLRRIAVIEMLFCQQFPYNIAIYVGYSMSYAVGNGITNANIDGQSWRWAFFISGAPGFLLAVILFLTVRDPRFSSILRPRGYDSFSETNASVQADTKKDLPESASDAPENAPVATTSSDSPNNSQNQADVSVFQRLKFVLLQFARPTPILLCIAGGVRNAAGYVASYNTQNYFETVGQTPTEIASWMSWVPIVGGSIGAVLGGFISDWLSRSHGSQARVFVVCVSQMAAAPFVAGVLFLPAPWCYLTLIPSNIFGEMWIGVCLAIVVELLPSSVRTTGVATYLFIITNIGGNIPLLVPVLRDAFQASASYLTAFRLALYILYPGLYVASSILFACTLLVLRRDLRRSKTVVLTGMENPVFNEHRNGDEVSEGRNKAE